VLPTVAVCAALLCLASYAHAISRSAVIATAESYASLHWHCSALNADAEWNSLEPDTDYVGMAYNWGGDDTSCWECGRYSTSNIATICDVVQWSDLKAGDALNDAESHVRLFHEFTRDTNWMTCMSPRWV